ncbi:MAG: serine acetyltransferase [Verrucomicrobiae bacterium]|nr:serine acetyltransferase [Verrucomicrobiae bacterium]
MSRKGLDQIAGRIVASYRSHGGINHIDGSNLPSKEVVAEITRDLLRLLFPGFMEPDVIHSSEVREYVTALSASISARLQKEIVKALNYKPCPKCDLKRLDQTARQVTLDFLDQIPAIRGLLQTDVVATYEGDPAAMSQEEIIVAYPGLEAIAVQRMAHVLYLKQVPLIPRIMTEFAHSRTGIDIHPGAQIGSYFCIDHGTGVVIGETTVIGKRVKMYQGVTLGAKSFAKDAQGRIVKGGKRHPNIEDDVVIYAGATILGGDTTIGKGSIIGSNVWLMQSVPPRSIVYFENEQLRIKPRKEEDA